MHAEVAQVTVFGLLQGMSTFLPISSRAHVVLAEMLFVPSGISAAEKLVFLGGTLTATVMATAPLLLDMLRALLHRVRAPASRGLVPAERDLGALVLAQGAIATLWMALGDARDELSRQPTLIAIGLTLTSIALVSTAWLGPRARLHPTWLQALLIGAVHGMGLIPGISAIGCGIVAAMWMGLTARRSYELSLVISIPAAIASLAALVPEATLLPIPTSVGFLGFAVSAVAGFGAAQLLRMLVLRDGLAWFSIWVMPLAVATFAFARVWPVR